MPAGSMQDGNPSGNAHAGSGQTNHDMLSLIHIYMCFAEETVYPMDTWNEKITDSLNYLFLLKAIVKEGHTN